MALAQQADKEVYMPKRVSRNVKCPFYHSQDGGKIKCEGLSDKNTIHLVFKKNEDRAKFMRNYCNDVQSCKACLIHKMLYMKWGMDDE